MRGEYIYIPAELPHEGTKRQARAYLSRSKSRLDIILEANPLTMVYTIIVHMQAKPVSFAKA